MLLDNVTPAGARGRFPSAERGKAVRLRSDQIDVPSMRLHFARTRNANIIPHVRAARAAPGTGRFPLKSILLVASALVASHAAQAADLGVADLPRIHAEYKANQARWAREFLDKTFAATITLGGVSNVLGNDSFMVTFLETRRTGCLGSPVTKRQGPSETRVPAFALSSGDLTTLSRALSNWAAPCRRARQHAH
jgi:hypothetical protein